MAKKSVQELMRGVDFDAMAAETDIAAGRLRSIALEGAAMLPVEAVTLAQHFQVDAKVLLDLQTEEQLKKLDYVAPKAAKTTTTTQRASKTSSSRALGNSADSDMF